MVKFWVFFALLVAVIGSLGNCDGGLDGSPFNVTINTHSGKGQKGSGDEKSETRPVGTFDKIHAEGIGKLEVEVKEGLVPALEVSTDDNLLPLVKTEVHSGTLEIGAGESINPRSGLTVKIKTPSLAAVHLEGANKMELAIDSSKPLELHLEGAAKVTASGKVPKFTVHSEGASKVEATELVAQEVDVQIAGAGHAKVNATDTLRGQIEGAGVIAYKGQPRNVEREIAGIGKISRID